MVLPNKPNVHDAIGQSLGTRDPITWVRSNLITIGLRAVGFQLTGFLFSLHNVYSRKRPNSLFSKTSKPMKLKKFCPWDGGARKYSPFTPIVSGCEWALRVQSHQAPLRSIRIPSTTLSAPKSVNHFHKTPFKPTGVNGALVNVTETLRRVIKSLFIYRHGRKM